MMNIALLRNFRKQLFLRVVVSLLLSFGLLSPPWLVVAAWSDADSDGYNDLWTDPDNQSTITLADLDGNRPDVDFDGASNTEEAAAGSNPYRFDSDYDGISDGDEIHLTQTSPNNWDSDGDEVSDYDDYRGFTGVTYPNGQLPQGYSNPSTYSDYDGDGFKNPDDPAPTDMDNYGAANSISWYTDALLDYDGDGIKNFFDDSPYPPLDSDSDGFNDTIDPFPTDFNNYSSVNGISWGEHVFEDADGDLIPNWNDASPYFDDDGDGINNALDPFPTDSTNYSYINGISWYGDVSGDADNDGISNWEDPSPSPPLDDDGDGFINSVDPFPNDSSNFSSTNNIAWYGEVLGDADNDGTLNYNDFDPYPVQDQDGDGISDSSDPNDSDPTNYSEHNGIYWGPDALGDADGDGVMNWYDTVPYPDDDNDGLPNPIDPYPWDASNQSYINNIHWYELVLGDLDGDGTPNWEDDVPYGADGDGDGLGFAGEALYGTRDDDVDCDDDGLSDFEELIIYHSDPNNAFSISQDWGWGDLYQDYYLVDLSDQDVDGIPDRVETHYGMNSDDPVDASGDLDGNGISNLSQYQSGWALNADLVQFDADGDGMTDFYEDFYSLNKNDPGDALGDGDNDGVLNFEEHRLHLSPNNPDTQFNEQVGDLCYLMIELVYPNGGQPGTGDDDENGISDWADAVAAAANPYFVRQAVNDLDGDGMSDAWEFQYGLWKFPANGLNLRINDAEGDPDGDQLSNLMEYQHGTHPLIADTDADGVNDGEEDADGDGLGNALELLLGFNSLDPDSDNDGESDAHSAAPNDLDRDGLMNVQEATLGRNPQWKDHPSVGLSAGGLTSP